MTKAFDLIGKKFERLTVKKRVKNGKHGEARWLCNCQCGNTTIVKTYHLTSGKIRSCGCIKKEILKKRENIHHKSNTKIYKIWASIKQRCTNSKHKNCKRYKERGIKICEQWKRSFVEFYNWAISSGYKEGLTIERINNNGNYEPSNCRWATRKEQANNTSRNHFVYFNGERHTISEWSKKLGIKYSVLENRLRRKISLERCFHKGKLSNNGVDFYD